MLAGTDDLIAIDETGEEEIDDGLHPERLVLESYVLQCRTHGRQAQESADAVCGGDEPADALPQAGDVVLWPAQSSEEEEGHGGENDEQDDVFAVAYHTRDGHAEEDDGQ